MAKIRVLIADSAEISLTGILAILKDSRQIEIIATASNASEAIRLYGRHTPDICLIANDLSMLNIHAFMQAILKKDLHARVIVLTDITDLPYLNQTLKSGVSGCLSKNIEKKELVDAILDAANGERVFSKSISSLITHRYVDLARNRPGRKSESITKRESEVLQLIVDGYTSQEIAGLLYISPRTVETHRANLLQKLKIKNTVGLVRYALQKGHYSNS